VPKHDTRIYPEAEHRTQIRILMVVTSNSSDLQVDRRP